MKSLLLEIGVEPIPPSLAPLILDELGKSIESFLRDNGVNFAKIFTFGTNRRLVVSIEGLDEFTPSKKKEFLGPPWEKAFSEEGKPLPQSFGFSKKFNLSTRDLKKIKKGNREYAGVVIVEKGKPLKDILRIELPKIILSLKLPQSMYWGRKEFSFIRPVKWILCLFGEEIIKFSVGSINSDRFSYGHFLLSREKIKIDKAEISRYLDKLRDNFVICNPDERKKEIVNGVKKNLYKDEEIIGESEIEKSLWSTEKPFVIRGNFPERFLSLPSEVLTASMIEHQSYLPIKKRGVLTNSFLVIGEGKEENRNLIIKGHQRVLVSRLMDAEFFFKEDMKIPIKERVKELSSITFHEKLGNLYDKTKRIVRLSEKIAEVLNLSSFWKEIVLRSAYLSKADLLTKMVDEFPSLQGIMGEIYSLLQGEKKEVSEAIGDHYFPFSKWRKNLPRNIAGKIISIADKIDTLCGYTSLGYLPKGSYDPYGLKRQSFGIISILLGKDGSKLNIDEEMRIPLRKILSISFKIWGKENKTSEIMNIIYARIKSTLLEEGIRYDIVESVLGAGDDLLQDIYLKAKALEKLQKEGKFSEIMTPYKRIANILRQAEKDFSIKETGKVKESLITQEEEGKLWKKMKKIKNEIPQLVMERNYSQVLNYLVLLKPMVDEYFDNVLVMEKEALRRENHLAILGEIRGMFSPLLDFSTLKEEKKGG